MIENLKNINRQRIIIASFRSRYFRQPNESELRIWKDYLISGHTINEMLIAMAGKNSDKQIDTQLLREGDICSVSMIDTAKKWDFTGAEDFFSLFERQIRISTEASGLLK